MKSAPSLSLTISLGRVGRVNRPDIAATPFQEEVRKIKLIEGSMEAGKTLSEAIG
jgi:hypothetical protein